jgi:spore coat polysaccharide biosynthesis protein SpsF
MKRRLVAAIACRNQGSRLYGKPLQRLEVEKGVRIIDNIVDCLKSINAIDEILLGISEGIDSAVFIEIAEEKGLRYVVGDQIDVLSRLISCGKLAGATDVFRVTSESPFLYFEPVEELWARHQGEKLDATFMWDIIDGSGFEIYTLGALVKSHARGSSRHRSELCSLYVREHPNEFRVLRVEAPPELVRKDIRLTVDYPEDLVVCRAVYEALQASAPRISVFEIVKYLDERPRLLALLAPYTSAGYGTMDFWAEPATQPIQKVGERV